MINYDEIIYGFLQLIERETKLLREGKDSKIVNFELATLKSGEEYEIELAYEKSTEDGGKDKSLLIRLDIINLTDFIIFDGVDCVFIIEIVHKGVVEELNWLLLPPNNKLTDNQKVVIANGLDTEGWKKCGQDVIKDMTNDDCNTFFNIISNINYLREEENKRLQYEASQQHILDIISDMINKEV